MKTHKRTSRPDPVTAEAEAWADAAAAEAEATVRPRPPIGLLDAAVEEGMPQLVTGLVRVHKLANKVAQLAVLLLVGAFALYGLVKFARRHGAPGAEDA